MAKRTAQWKYWKKIIFKWLGQTAIVSGKCFEKFKRNTNQYLNRLDYLGDLNSTKPIVFSKNRSEIIKSSVVT